MLFSLISYCGPIYIFCVWVIVQNKVRFQWRREFLMPYCCLANAQSRCLWFSSSSCKLSTAAMPGTLYLWGSLDNCCFHWLPPPLPIYNAPCQSPEIDLWCTPTLSATFVWGSKRVLFCWMASCWFSVNSYSFVRRPATETLAKLLKCLFTRNHQTNVE